MTDSTTDSKAIALAYLDAVSTKNLGRCASLIAPDVKFTLGSAASYTGLDNILAAFRRISSIHVRNDVVKVFVDGNDVCVIYDFVTDTHGTLPTIEWLRDRARQDRDVIHLYYDQVPWTKMREEMTRRAQARA